MKKALFFAGLAAAVLSLAGCNREADVPGHGGREVQIILSDVATRTINYGLSTEWKAGDELSVFTAPAGTATWSANTKFTVNDASTNQATGEVELTADAYDWYAFYPYTRQIPNPTTLNPEGSTYERSGYVTVGGQFQSQKTDDNTEHLAGTNVPVFGNVKNVPAAETPVIEMKNAASVACFKVTNALGEAIKILSVKFTAPEDIVGTYYIDFSGTAPAFVGSGESYVKDNVTVTNADPSEVAPDSNGEFYAVIKPFTAAAGAKLKVEVEAENVDGTKKGTTVKEITLTAASEFKSGSIKTLNIPFDAPLTSVTAAKLPYEQAFSGGAGDFTIEDKVGSGIWTPGSASGQTFMKGTSYLGGSNTEGESWLVSPEIDATTAENGVKLSFKQCVNKFFGNVAEEATLWAREKEGEWKQFTITYPTPTGTWSQFEEQVVDLSEFKGKVFQFAFKYVGHATSAGTWEVNNVLVKDEAVAPTFLAELVGPSNISAKTTSVQINVTADVSWTATPSDGVTLDKAEGEGDAVITASFPANTEATPKEYSVLVSTDNPAVENDEWEITFTQAAASPDTGEPKFVKVTAAADLTDGQYLIVNEKASVALKDAVDQTKNTIAVTISDAEIEATAAAQAAAFTFTASNGAFKGPNGKYLAHSGTSNSINPTTDPSANTVTISDGDAVIKASDNYFIQYNKSSGQERFRYYKNAQTDGAVQLYKLSGEGGSTPTATLVSIAVSGQKTAFNVGDAFTHDTAVVTATYSDNSTKDVSASATFSSPDMTTAGTKEVTVTYQEGGVTKTTSYNITVTADDPDTNTVSLTMTDYVAAHGCTVSAGNDVTMYKTLQLNASVRMSTTGDDNCGSFWNTSNTNTEKQWRLYQNKGGNVIITVAQGCTLKSVKLTYVVSNNGTLLDGGGNTVATDAVQTASGTSVTYTVGNTANGTSGQVRVTAVEVKYSGNGTTFPDNPDPQPTEIETKITMDGSHTVYIGETFELNATSNVPGAAITYESEDPAIATVSAAGVVTGVAEGTVKVYARIAGVEGQYTNAERYCNVTVAQKPSTQEGTWEATALSAIADGAEFVLVSTKGTASYAMSNENGTGAAPSAVAVTVTGNTISSPASNLVFVLKKVDGGYVFGIKDKETTLYCFNNNNGIRVGTGEHNVFTQDADSGYLVINDGAQNRYLGVYNNADWRAYTTINNNIKDQTFTFFVKK